MLKTWFKVNWMVISSLTVCVCILTWAAGCESKVKSLNGSNCMVNRQEMQLEIQNFLAVAKMRTIALDEQDRLRELLLQNASRIATTGTVDPFGIVTGLLAFYGIGAAGTNIKNAVKKKSTS